MTHSPLSSQNFEQNFEDLIRFLGEDPSREGLVDTPKRMVRSMDFLTQGYHQDLTEIVGQALFDCDSSEMVVSRDIEFYSLCEHHMLPFWGMCHVAYLPQKKVLGLSKIPRIVDMFARRLQIQESMTYEIGLALQEVLQIDDVAVLVTGRHFCMMMRGVSKQNVSVDTRYTSGQFKDPVVFQDFLSSIKGSTL